MTRMRNPYTDELADVEPDRATVLEERGWERADTDPAADASPAAVPGAETQLLEARAVAEWLVAEAEWNADQERKIADRELLVARNRTEQLQVDVERLTTELADRPTVEQLEQLQAELEEATKPEPPADTAPAKPQAAAKPKTAPQRRK